MPEMETIHQKWEYLQYFVIITFFIVVFANTAPLALFLLIIIDVTYVNSCYVITYLWIQAY